MRQHRPQVKSNAVGAMDMTPIQRKKFEVSEPVRKITVGGDTMPRYDIAHIHEQGQDLIIVPLVSAFGSMSSQSQASTMRELENRAHSAGLAGHVVAVWDAGGSMRFLGPRPWHGFLSSINPQWVAANINKSLSW